MLRKFVVGFILLCLLVLQGTPAARADQFKISVFNFGTLNMEASGLGTNVTNILSGALKNNDAISLLDRKDLETFLSLNELQQNDKIDNVVRIGSMLSLDFIIVGSVEKHGSAIAINCKVINIDKRKAVYNKRVTVFGEAALTSEVVKIASLITKELDGSGSEAGANQKAIADCPINLQKFPGNRKITLRWREAAAFTAAGYEVHRALAAAGPFALAGQTDKTEYIDQDVENNTVYFYKVRAIDKAGQQSSFTSVISASPDFAPNPPIIIKTEGRAKSIRVIWVPSPSSGDDPAKLAGFRIFRAKTEDGQYKELAKLPLAKLAADRDGKICYHDKEVADGETFYYRLIAFNEKDIESEFCSPVKGTALSVIGLLTAQSDLIREVQVSWKGVQSPFIAAYNIYRSGKSEGEFTQIKKINAVDNAENYVYSDFADLGDKTKYFYRITIEDDAGGETSPSPVIEAITRGIPPQPESFTAAGGLVKKIALTWQAAKQEEVEGYNIYWAPEKDGQYNLLKKINGRENNSYVDDYRGFDKLDDNKTYHYRLHAFNKVAAESLPAVALATTKPRPQKPLGLKGQSLLVKEAPLEWQANPEKDISVYHIYQAIGEKDNFSYIAKADTTSYTDKNLQDGVTYRYRIQAEDKDGLLSDYSDIISINTKPKPGAPQGVTGKFEEGKAVISWSKNNESDIARYAVYVKRFLGADKIGEVSELSYADATIVKGKSKTYVITAVDKDGLESEKSEEIIITAK